MRTCKGCSRDLPDVDFYRSGSQCKVCIRKASSARYWKNRDAVLAVQRKRLQDNPNYSRNANLKQNYGITLEEFDLMESLQGGVCAICRDRPKRLFVDHCHSSGTVRGLLCHHCNVMLGLARESERTLLEAASYLRLRKVFLKEAA